METYKEQPLLTFDDAESWQNWLHHNNDSSGSVWLKFAKKGAGETTISYEQAREGALIYGWIDGLKHKYDERFYVLRFSPRQPKSLWSKINREIVEALIATGKMQPSGLAQVEAAKADGRWEAAYDSPSTMSVPDDFAARLEQSPNIKEFFASLSNTNRYAILHRIQTARTPTSRERQIQKALELLEQGESDSSLKRRE